MSVDAYDKHQGSFESWRREGKATATGGNVSVTDQAMFRYLKRACEIKVDAMREMIAAILSPMVGAANGHSGSGD